MIKIDEYESLYEKIKAKAERGKMIMGAHLAGMRHMSKRGMGIIDLAIYGLMFVIVTVILALGGMFLQDMFDTDCLGAKNGSMFCNITTKGLDALWTFAKWLPLAAMVVIISIIVGILIWHLLKKLIGGMQAG